MSDNTADTITRCCLFFVLAVIIVAYSVAVTKTEVAKIQAAAVTCEQHDVVRRESH